MELQEIKTNDALLKDKFVRLFLDYRLESNLGLLKDEDYSRLEYIADSHSAGNYRLWLAFIDSDTAGFSGLSGNRELSPAWVMPNHRRKGLHSIMMRKRIDEGGRWGRALKTNHASIASFQKNGFTLTKEYEKLYEFELLKS